MVDRADSDTIQIKVRIKEAVRAELEASAKANKWPLNREIANRLEKSLQANAVSNDPHVTFLLQKLANDIVAVERLGHAMWHEDFHVGHAVSLTVRDTIQSLAPMPPNSDQIIGASSILESRKEDLANIVAESKGKDRARLVSASDAVQAAKAAKTEVIDEYISHLKAAVDLYELYRSNKKLALALSDYQGTMSGDEP